MNSDRIRFWILAIIGAALFGWAVMTYFGKRAECEARGLVPVRTIMAMQWKCGTVEP